MIRKKIFAVLVSDGSPGFMDLRSMLKILGVEIWSAYTGAEAARLVEQTHPELIFTAVDLVDGTWNENVVLVENASVPTNAIVVGKNKDIGLYLAAMDGGAFDFILPPFEPVLAVSQEPDPDFRHQAMRMGAADCLDHPVLRENMVHALLPGPAHTEPPLH